MFKHFFIKKNYSKKLNKRNYCALIDRVLVRFFRVRDRAILALLLISLFVIFLSVFSKIIITIRFEQINLRSATLTFFMKNFNKAIKFDDISIGYSGNILLKNCSISSSVDFNDSDELIKSKNAVIVLSYFDLLRGTISIKKLIFKNPSIIIQKKFGKTYKESIVSIFGQGKSFNAINNISLDDGITLIIDNAVLTYAENMANEKIHIEIINFKCKVEFKNNIIDFDFSGDIKSAKTNAKSNGSFDISGSCSGIDNYSISTSVSDFDLYLLNPYLDEFHLSEYQVSGGFSTDLKIKNRSGLKEVSGRSDFLNMFIKNRRSGMNPLSDENLTYKYDLSYMESSGEYFLKKIVIKNDIFLIDIKGKAGPEIFDLTYQTNLIDLTKLSRIYNVLPNYSFSGEMQTSGRLKYDRLKFSAEGSEWIIKAKDLALAGGKNGKKNQVIKAGSFDFLLKGSMIKAKLSAQIERGDIAVAVNTVISAWDPFTSRTKAEISSKSFEGKYFYKLFSSAYAAVTATAIESKKTGMDDEFFLQKDIGRFIQRNNLNLNITIGRVLIGKSAKLNNFKSELDLSAGTLFLNDFHLEGYGADYKLNIQALLNYDVPNVKLSGRADNFNLGEFYKQTGGAGSLTGIFSCGFEYDVSGFRAAQFLENSKGEFSLAIEKGRAEGIPVQLKINSFIRENGIPGSDLAALEFEKISIDASLFADLFYIRSFIFNSGGMNFYGYGKYSYSDGIDTAIAPRITVSGGRTEEIKLKITGILSNPRISLDKKGALSLQLNQ